MTTHISVTCDRCGGHIAESDDVDVEVAIYWPEAIEHIKTSPDDIDREATIADLCDGCVRQLKIVVDAFLAGAT